MYKEFAVSLAEEAGNIMVTNFGLGMKREWKSDNTPLTESDSAINKLVVEAVQKQYPSHSVLGEEQSSEKEGGEFVWVCDPIDGTIPFSHGCPLSTFSLALCQNGKPIVGVVFDPFLNRLLVAEEGKGTTLNGEKVSVSSAETLKSTVINVESWRAATHNIPGLSAKLGTEGVKITKFCAVVYGGMLVSCGEFAATIFAGKTPWDIAAIKLICEEAGGKVTDLYGSEQRYDQPIRGAIISNGKLHHQLQSLVSSCFVKG